jgi:signal transduction histidine kinase
LAKAKDQFILSIQHHLRTPLTPVMGYLDMILEGSFGEEKNPLIKEKLIKTRKAVEVLHKLMEDLLEVSSMRIGKKVLDLKETQIEDLIEEVKLELENQAKEKGLYLKFEKPKVPLPKMKLDEKRIREVIWNLIDNAIKYTERGGVVIDCKIQDSKCLIKIKDTGIGMTKEEIDYFSEGKLFERGEKAKKLWGPGRGIGLAISFEFVKAHGGKIWIESEGREKGTTFYVELPIK